MFVKFLFSIALKNLWAGPTDVRCMWGVGRGCETAEVMSPPASPLAELVGIGCYLYLGLSHPGDNKRVKRPRPSVQNATRKCCVTPSPPLPFGRSQRLRTGATHTSDA